MANRYTIQITDLDGTTTTCHITQTGTTGDDPETVRGNVIVAADPINNPREIFRGQTAQIYLEADQTQTFGDLFTEQPKQWSVEITRGVDVIFVGWLENDTVIEDWVNDRWVVEFTANDGLRDLQNVGYADTDGNKYVQVTYESLRTHLIRALKKTGLDLDVRFVKLQPAVESYPIRLRTNDTTPATYDDYFDQTIDGQTFIQDDGETPFRCGDLIRSILFPANAFIVQHGGVWTICWLLSIPSDVLNGVLDFRRYDSDGVFQTTEQLNISETIGSQIGGFSLHWADENQRLERRPSLGTAKTVYIFGPLGDLIRNNQFVNNGTTIPNWTINQAGTVTPNAAPINTVSFTTASTSEQNPALTSDASIAQIRTGQTLKWRAIVQPDPPTLAFYNFRQRVRIILSGTGGTYYLDENNFWTTTARRIELFAIANLASAEIEFGFDTPPVPIDGSIQLIIYPVDDDSGSASFIQNCTWKSVSFGALDTANESTQFSVTAQRLDNPSPVTFEPDPGTIGDNLGTIFRSTLYQSDGNTPTEFGYYHPTIPLDDSSLYETAAVDLLILQNKIAKYFSGGVYGFMPYFSRVQIDGIPGVFMVVDWAWDVGRNTMEIKLWEVFYLKLDILDPDPFFGDYDVLAIRSSGENNVKPVIRG